MTSNIHYGGQAPQTRSHWGAYSPPAHQRYDFVGLCRRLQVRYPEMLARVLAEEPELGEDQLPSFGPKSVGFSPRAEWDRCPRAGTATHGRPRAPVDGRGGAECGPGAQGTRRSA